MSIKLRAVIACEGPGCEATAEVLLDLGDVSLDLNGRVLDVVNCRVPNHWDDNPKRPRCPMCYLRNV